VQVDGFGIREYTSGEILGMSSIEDASIEGDEVSEGGEWL